jgi:hypothetical protein
MIPILILTLFFTRKFVLLIGLMSVLSLASSDKTLHCTFSNFLSYDLNQILRTCNVQKQAINSAGFSIVSPVDSTVKRFRIENNPRVEFLPENLSEKFPSLAAVEVQNCAIKSVSEHHLKGLHDLIGLYLGFNKIKTIDNNAFKDNLKLEYLALGFNKIKYLSDDLFKSLRNLKQLFLNDNQIRYIDQLIFKTPTSLERIDMDNNEVKFLHPETFSTLSNLKNISIANNQLVSINGKLLANNKKLKRISFGNNKLRSIDAEVFNHKKSLLYVDLEGNSCIDGSFNSSSFTSMKTQIEEIDSLKRDLMIAINDFSDQLESLKDQLAESKESKYQELEQCKQEKVQEVIDLTARADIWKEVLDTCKSFLRN